MSKEDPIAVVPEAPRTVRIGNTDVPIHPRTGRPTPGTIIDGHHKINWSARDIEEIYGMVEFENNTGITQCCVHGVRYSVPCDGEIHMVPAIVRDTLRESARAERRKESELRRTGGTVQVGMLEPKDY